MEERLYKKQDFEVRKQLFNSLEDDLRCHKCKELPRPEMSQIFRCFNSHTICSNCNSCCSQIYLNRFGSKLIKIMPFECKHKKYGCNGIFMAEDLIDHEETCDSRKVYCAAITCHQQGVQLTSMN